MNPQPMRVLSAITGALMLSILAAACGSSGSRSSSSATKTAAGSSTPTSAVTTGATVATTSVSTGPVHGTLTADNHAPVVKQNWAYTITVTNASGHPLSGTVDIEFLYAGQVVGRDTPPTHPVKDGRWHDYLQFPAAAAGQPLIFQAVVHTRLGSITLDWPITPKR